MVPSGLPSEGRPVAGAGMRGAAQAGFSMVEVLMALFLLVLIITAVSRTLTNARRVQQGAYHVEQASAFAQGKMDQLAAASLRTVNEGLDTVKTPMGLAFVRSWTALDRGTAKEVVVSVTWRNGGREHLLKLGTLVR